MTLLNIITLFTIEVLEQLINMNLKQVNQYD